MEIPVAEREGERERYKPVIVGLYILVQTRSPTSKQALENSLDKLASCSVRQAINM